MNARKARKTPEYALGKIEGYDEGCQKTAAEYMRLINILIKESEKDEPEDTETE